jgi:hypothetical protein
MTELADPGSRLYRALIIGFAGQIVGRLVDLQWHLTHSAFETGADQVRAHLVMWIATLFIIVVAAMALRRPVRGSERRGYLVVLVGNLAFAVVGVIHFFQHLNNQEVDWAHFLLAVTNIAAAAGVIWVILARAREVQARS